MTVTGIIPSKPSPQLAVVLAFLQGWCNFDLKAIVDQFVDDGHGLYYAVAPASLEMAVITSKQEFLELYEVLFVMRLEYYAVSSYLSKYLFIAALTQLIKMEIVDIIESPFSGRIVVQVRRYLPSP